MRDKPTSRQTWLGKGRHFLALPVRAGKPINDGIALATILMGADRNTAPKALLAYERLRRERVAEVQRGARENGMRPDGLEENRALP
jgi:salicylate hydroxylase